jgi:hypothetical protein
MHSHCPARGAHCPGQELVEDEVLANEPSWHEASLLGLHQPALDLLEPLRKNLGQNTVIPIQQRDGAVVVGVGALPSLVQSNDDAIKEPKGHLPCCPNGRVEGRQQGGKDVCTLPVEVHG